MIGLVACGTIESPSILKYGAAAPRGRTFCSFVGQTTFVRISNVIRSNPMIGSEDDRTGLFRAFVDGWKVVKPSSHFLSDRPVKRGRFLKDIENLTCAVHATPPRLPDSRDNVQHFQPVDRPLGRRECHVQSGG